MFLPRSFYTLFLGSAILLFLGCDSTDRDFGAIGLVAPKEAIPLTELESRYVEGDYNFFASLNYENSWSTEKKYLYLRSLFHKKNWDQLAEVFRSKQIPFQHILLGPYFTALALATDIQKHDEKSARKHYQIYLRYGKEFSPYLGDETIRNSYAAFANLPTEALSSGGFHYYRYEQNQSRKTDLLAAIRAKYSEALQVARFSNFQEAVPRSSWGDYLPSLKNQNTALYLEILSRLGRRETLSRYYFQKGKYGSALKYAPANSFLYYASLLMTTKKPLSEGTRHYIQAHPSEMGVYLSAYEFRKKDYRTLASLQMAQYIPNTLRYFLALSLNMHSVDSSYQYLNKFYRKFFQVLTGDDKELLLFWLGVLSEQEGKTKEAKIYYMTEAKEFPNSYYGSEALEELSTGERKEVLQFFKDDYRAKKDQIQNFVQDVNLQKLPHSLVFQRALFFLRIRENERGKAYLGQFLRNFSKEKLALLYYPLAKEFYQIERMDYFAYYFGRFFRIINRKVPGAFLFSDILPYLYPKKFESIVEEAAQTYHFDPSILEGLILQESLYDPMARSVVGASGLSQLMPATFSSVSQQLFKKGIIHNQNIWDVRTNIFVGAAYLSWLMEKVYRDAPPEEKMILSYASYNAGMGHIRKLSKQISRPLLHGAHFVESIDFAETRGYTKKLIRNQRIYALLRSRS